MIDRAIRAPISPTMGMDVDGNVGVFLANGANKERCSLRFQHTSHVLDTNDVCADVDNFFGQAHIIFEVVLLLGV